MAQDYRLTTCVVAAVVTKVVLDASPVMLPGTTWLFVAVGVGLAAAGLHTVSPLPNRSMWTFESQHE